MPKRCGTLARCSLGPVRDVTLTSFPPLWVSGLTGAGGGQPHGGGDSCICGAQGLRAGAGRGSCQPGCRASFVRGWGGRVTAILASGSRHEGGVGARGQAARGPVPAPAPAPHPAFCGQV